MPCYRSMVTEPIDPVLAVLAYHDRTKHRPGRYANALGYMDWRTQPDPYRRFPGAPLLPLEVVPPTPAPTWDEVLEGRVPPAPLDRRFVSQLLFDSLALSAWKVAGPNRWALRVNPSSGNLHPTEGYVVSGPVAGLLPAPAVLHYAPAEHALELRRTLGPAEWALLCLPEDALLIALTSIHWRESWKYGERAFRYCHHDVGHAIAAVTLSASALGWAAHVCDHVPDRALAVLLGVADQTGPEAERADCLLALWPRRAAGDPAALELTPALLEALRGRPPLGMPNRLSEDHHPWPIIDAVSAATERVVGAPAESHAPSPPSFSRRPPSPARPLLRTRRSAVALDAETGLDRETFFALLARVASPVTPLCAMSWRPRVDLLLFVHRVRDLSPGLYLLVRASPYRDALRAATASKLRWERVPGAPDDVDLVLLLPGDVRDAAKISSCGQDIAADGAFAVAMLARFEPTLRELGADMYRRLHWEAGAIGQVLYLEAEAAGLRGTGIGCFFDDVVHTVLGLEDETYRDLYHFTIGGPVEDERIQTAPAYPEGR